MWTHVSSLRDKQIAGLAASDKWLGWGKDAYNNSHQVITGVVFPIDDRRRRVYIVVIAHRADACRRRCDP
jgi:hypothetical protein